MRAALVLIVILFAAYTSAQSVAAPEPQIGKFETALNQLEEWLISNEGYSGKIKPVLTSSSQISMEAIEDISAGEVLMSIPMATIITPVVANALIPLAEERLMPTTHMALALLKIRFGAPSNFQLITTFLPKVMGNTVYYSEADLQLLKGTSLFDITELRKRQIAAEYHVAEVFLKKYPDLLPANSFDINNFVWALCTVLAYGVPIDVAADPVSYVMLPKWNFFSHNDAPTTIRYDAEKKAIVVVTMTNWKKGEQVYVSYGDLANDELLLTHGVVMANNPHDNFHLIVDQNQQKTRIALFENGKLSQAMLSTLRQQYNVLTQAAVNFSQPISLENELKTLNALLSVISTQLESYPTTLREDDALLADPQLTEVPKIAAIIVRRGEKRLLELALHEIAALWMSILERGSLN